MSDERENRLFGRKRRANVPVEQKRDKRYTVKVSAHEDAVLRARAEALGVTVSRLLFESAVNSRVQTDTEWKSAGAELAQLRYLMGKLSANMNQLARFANTEGRFPTEAVEVADHYRALVPKVDEALRRLKSQ